MCGGALVPMVPPDLSKPIVHYTMKCQQHVEQLESRQERDSWLKQTRFQWLTCCCQLILPWNGRMCELQHLVQCAVYVLLWIKYGFKSFFSQHIHPKWKWGNVVHTVASALLQEPVLRARCACAAIFHCSWITCVTCFSIMNHGC